jgi:hypothetical protein
LPIDTIVGVKEYDKAGLFKRSPYRIKGLVIEALADPARAHYNSFQIRQLGYLFDCFQESSG